MTRLIDADALKAQIQREIDIYFDEDGGGIHTAMEARDEIDYAPTVDAEPVRHGTWKEERVKIDGQFSLSIPCYLCSECGGYMDASPLLFKYCPYCGANMDGLEE